jgi:molybdopterin-guanine dinucleotide biosynthesis adapter protein
MPPLFSIIGRKHAGKTTLVVRLVAELHRRGHRVMTIKHGAHTFNIDPATTDTYRHYHEGHAERVVMAAPDKFALVMRWSEELPPETIAERYLADADVVVCEGFKRSTLPKIEIFRRAAHEAPLYRRDDPTARHYLGIVTDDVTLEADVPLISLADPQWLDALATLVEREVMRPAARE